MKDIIIVDTDILIDSAMKIDEAVDCLDAIEQRSVLAISVITQMELFVGCRNKNELKTVNNFLKRFEIINDTQTRQPR